MKLYRYRRAFQLAFFILFFTLLTLTVWPLGQIFLGAFILADPLITVNSLANGIWKWEMIIAVIVLIGSFLLGRVFCGYVCPLGFTIELLAPKTQAPVKKKFRDILIKIPTFTLIIIAGLFLFGSAFFLVFDPISLMTRSSTVLLYPLLDRIARTGGDVLYLIQPLRLPVDIVTNMLSGKIIFQKALSYQFQFGILVMFAVLVGISIWQRRLWCRYICPLGALLGLAGRNSPYGRVVDKNKCINCLKCERVCSMDAIRADGNATDTSRCQLGFECADICPEKAIHFGFKPNRVVYNPSRRAFIVVAGLAVASGFFISTGITKRQRNVRLIRPPGARRENDFMAICSRCGQCLKVCPTNVLQPSVTESGLEGLLTPQLDFNHAFCDWTCNECGKVCPTGAIETLTLKKKQKKVIGRAYIDKNRCIPWADFKDCLVCEELCPIPNKAIKFAKAKVKKPTGDSIVLKRPHVLSERCIGCGICEFNCPVANEAAINVKAT